MYPLSILLFATAVIAVAVALLAGKGMMLVVAAIVFFVATLVLESYTRRVHA